MRFKIKHNTTLGVSWIADERGNTIELSQDIKGLQEKCDFLNMLQDIADNPHSIERCRDAAKRGINNILGAMGCVY